MKVHLAADVETALKHFGEHKIDVILSDINLGEDVPDGYAFLKHVREADKTVPFYMVSGYSRKEEEQKALQNGATAYVQLPINKDQLVTLVS